MHEVNTAEQYTAPFETRADTGVSAGRMGLWWFLASEVAIFGGLIVIFLLYRLNHSEWGAYAENTINLAGAFNTMVLLSSSLLIVLAHDAVEKGRVVHASKLMNLTVLMGFVFLGVKSYEYIHEIQAGFTPVTNLFWSFYFLMTGLHALHVIAGMVAIFVTARAVKRGEHLQRVEYVGMYWHLVDIVWIFLFPLLYLAS